jgi:hypothetical protein
MSTKSSISVMTRWGSLALFALFAARPALATDYVPGDSTTYPTAGVRVVTEPNVEPGPIASHLIYLGESRDQAVADAEARGEQPRPVNGEPIRQARSSFQTYEHVLGLSPVGTQPTRKNRAFIAPAARS